METKPTIQDRRTYLKEISAPFKALKKAGELPTINEGLRKLYESKGHLNLKTLREWNEIGRKVKKGERALLMWGTPKKRQPKPEDTEADELDFYPICFLFSEQQTE